MIKNLWFLTKQWRGAGWDPASTILFFEVIKMEMEELFFRQIQKVTMDTLYPTLYIKIGGDTHV